jgi:glycerol-3-phosphate dehydrogenase (NAD(P)+)
MFSFTVLGAGSWGAALATLISDNGHPTYLWGRNAAQINEMLQTRVNSQYLPGIIFPASLNITSDLSQAVANVQIIVLAVPSQGFSETLRALKPHLKSPFHQFIIATKGLDPDKGCFLTETVHAILGAAFEVAVLSGPTFAAEVAAKQPSAIALACQSDTFAKQVIDSLHNAYFRVYRTTDMKGVQIGGVVKNILAIAAGIGEGLGFGANTQSALMTRGLAEMARLGRALGAKLETFLGLAGVGDLLLTATSNQSRNRRFGFLVGQGMDVKAAEQMIGQVVEGAHNAAQVYHLAHHHQVDMPIAQAVHRVLQGALSPREAVNELLARAPRLETF